MTLAKDTEQNFFWHNQPVDSEFEKASETRSQYAPD
jgi:hypothetical protein